jgi:ketosteroid isomerase-like protein
VSNANKEIVQRRLEALSAGSLAALDEAIGDEIVSFDPTEPAPLRGREAYLAGVEAYLARFRA